MSPPKVYENKKGDRGNYRSRLRSKISNRKPPNPSEIEKNDEFVSSSVKKIKLSKDAYDISVDSTFCYRIVCLSMILNTISTLQCSVKHVAGTLISQSQVHVA